VNPLLQALVDAASGLINANEFDARAANDARIAAVREALAAYRVEHPDETIDLATLERQALAEFEDRRSTASSSAAALAALAAVGDVAEALDTEIRTAQETAANADALADRLANRPARETPPPPAAPEGNAPAAGEPGGGEPQTPAAPPAGETPGAPAPSGGAPEPQAPATPAAPEPVLTASGRTPATTTPRVPMGALPNDNPGGPAGGARAGNTFAMTAAADIPNVAMGGDLRDINGLAQAGIARLHALARAGKDTSAGIATIQRTRADQRLVATEVNAHDVIEYACDETRLDGGSLVAAASWCAPAEVSYAFCPTAEEYGLINVPEVTATRGSLQWPVSPDFAAIYTNSGFYLTAADMAKGETYDPANAAAFRPNKPCYMIECPTNTRLDLDVMGLCVKTPTLTERAFPELITYVMAQLMVAHAHKRNAQIIREIEALTTAVALPGATPPEWGPGATATTLGLVELQIEYLRYRNRLGFERTIEMVAPAFLRAILRSDLAKRAGVDLLNVTNSMLDDYLRTRGANPQWVVDWQDAFAGPSTPILPDPAAPNPGTGLPTFDPAAWGGNTPPVAWPANVKIMLYPAGTFFVATNDILTIDGLYDSALLARNLHLALFTEEGIKVGTRGCYKGLTVTLPLCANGQTGGPVPNTETWDCANGAA